ncbi:MAG: ATP-dependent helicase [Kiritimatiellae bacterium]|nr:ATP-dependent helicase [Kiritimatiellia bacterium]
MTDFAQVLNPEQRAAATAPDGPLLVLAAAGTGKTRTLVHRVAYLVEKGVPAERILLLTFTNRAAREMLERAERLVPSVGGIWSGTFHHVCARFLRRYGSFLGYRPSFAILDEDDQKKLMNECIKALVKTPKDFVKKELLLKMLSDAKNRERPFEAVVKSYQTKTALDVEEVIKVGRAYEARKRELGAMDFDDLLVNGLRLLEENGELCAHLQEHFMHVLVDEYQDTNTLQARFTDILAAKSRNLMVVGDDFQCIYTWRGAQYENIMEFPERWPGCRIVKLERNYRSLAPILDVANIVMKDVPHSFEKTLRPFRSADDAPRPRLYRMYDGYVQAETILKLVQGLRERGVAYRDIAILYRSHYTSIDIQLTLTRNHIPFRITSGIGVFEQLHVKDVLAFLRLCLDPKAELSFMRLMALLPGVGEASARKWWRNLGGSFDGTDAMNRMNLDSMMSAKGRAGWEGISKAFAGARDHLKNGEGNRLVQDFVHFFYGDHLRRQFDEDEAEQRLEDLNEITAQIAVNQGGLEGFLNEVALMTNLDANARANLPADHLQLSTIHQAKGMEWPVVILPWLVDTVFPSARSVEDGNLDEERRLFYVAVTRAKDRLYLSVPRTKKTTDGGMYPVEPSIFIKEIPKELVEEQEIYSYTPEAMQRPRSRFDDDDDYGGGYGRGSSRWGGGYGGGSSRWGGGRGGKSGWKTTWRR